HQPFLSNALKETGFKLKSFAAGAATHVGLYSKKYKSFDQLPQNATVAIPNDPVNQGRALLLLQQAKLITLKNPENHLSNLSDIASNPKNLQFVEVEGPQTARAIDDVDLAFGYPHYLRLAKTADPESALLFDENTNKRYAILFVVREDYQDKDDKLKKFVSIYQNSAQVQQALNEDFGAKLWFPGWK
ncbi:MAG: MetQ/NlpA family ABC transporter substrate-binding protein, partial [Acinetobacter bohemicus]